MINTSIDNFSVGELKCKCGCGKFINDPTGLVALQAFRNYLELKFKREIPLSVNSGTRCLKHNDSVGGADGSMHTLGKAYDVTTVALNLNDLYKAAKASGLFRTVLKYNKSNFIHLDVMERPKYKTVYMVTDN